MSKSEPKKPMGDLILEGLVSLGFSSNWLYHSYFSENPAQAHLACALSHLIKDDNLSEQFQRIEIFVHNFSGLLEAKACHYQQPIEFFDLLNLAYRTYESLIEITNKRDIAPQTSIKELKLDNNDIIVLEKRIGQKTNYKPYVNPIQLENLFKEKVEYLFQIILSHHARIEN